MRRESKSQPEAVPDPDSHHLLDQETLLQTLFQLQGSTEAHQIDLRQSPSVLGGTLIPEPEVSSGRNPKTFSLEDRVRSAMLQVLTENPELSAAFDQFVLSPPSELRLKDPRSFPIPAETNQLGGKVQNPILDAGKPISAEQPVVLPSPSPTPPAPPVVEGGEVSPEVSVPTVTIKELEAEPGCRTFSTRTCTKLPLVVPKTVPYQECHSVPAVDCYFVLKTVDDLECSPVSFEDCKNNVVDVPYLAEEEQCEDVEFDECVDVEEQVPIQVCTVVDTARTPIINREIAGSKKRTGGRRTGNTRRPVARK